MTLSLSRRLTKVPIYLKNLNLFRSSTTAAILVIGDEVLRGDITDTNSPHITRELHKLGVKVKKISIIGDDVEDISKEVKNFSKLYTYVITTGGIGPTHDDVTFEAVARAFDIPLVLNHHLSKLCEEFYKTTDPKHPGMKLARVPADAVLTFSDKRNYPNIAVNNVYMFPGIPELFLRSFTKLSAKLFKSDDTTFYTRTVYFNLSEHQISEELSNLVDEFPDVQIGSYPKLFHETYKVKITIESTNETAVLEACNKLIEKFPSNMIVAVS